jgi:hypothetical protein
MAIDNAGNWWVGSVSKDIETYLMEYTLTDTDYPANAFRLIRCSCGSQTFRLLRALSMTQRTCSACGQLCHICQDGEFSGWEEAVQEESPEPCQCVECGSAVANVGVAFAGYPEDAELDAAKWFYVGVRCSACGILGCFNDGKVGRGPSRDIQPIVTGESAG